MMDITPVVLNDAKNDNEATIFSSAASHASAESFDEIYTYNDLPTGRAIEFGNSIRKQEQTQGASKPSPEKSKARQEGKKVKTKRSKDIQKSNKISLPKESELLYQAPMPPELLFLKQDDPAAANLRKSDPSCIEVGAFVDPPAPYSLERQKYDERQSKYNKKKQSDRVRNIPDRIEAPHPPFSAQSTSHLPHSTRNCNNDPRQNPSTVTIHDSTPDPLPTINDNPDFYPVEASLVQELPSAVAVPLTSSWWKRHLRIITPGVLLVVIAIAVLVTVLVLFVAPSNETDKSVENSLREAAAAFRAGNITQKLETVALLRNATFSDMDIDDPRYLALDWLLNDDEMKLDSSAKNLNQRYTLAMLAFSMGSRSWNYVIEDSARSDAIVENNTWLSSDDECSWYNVTCADGKVVALQLNNFSLMGTLPPEISRLTFLVGIQLEDNYLQGTIPPELQHLYFLDTLDLAMNLFTGAIPQEVGEMNALETLALWGNIRLNGTLPMSLYQLTGLKKLHLDFNDFSGTISEEIGKLSKLQRFTISNNRFSGSIPASLGLCNDMELLLIDGTEIHGTIPDEICALTAWHSSRQDYNTLSIRADCHPDNETGMPSITCDCCDACCNAQRCFASDQDYNEELDDELQEEQNHDSTETFAYKVNRTIQIKRKLENEVLQRGVSLYEINADDPRVLALDWILNIDGMGLDADAANLNQRYILALVAYSLGPEALGTENSSPVWLSGDDECSWHNEYCSETTCSWYNITCNEGKVIGMQIFNDHSLTGTIPPEICALDFLVALQMHKNSLHGTIPHEVVELPFLMGLDLSWNYLTGEIPQNIGNLESLEILSLEGNGGLTGELPKSLYEMSNLKYLLLGANDFSGSIGDEIGQLVNLKQFSIMNNTVNGAIPSTFGLCEHLELLSLENTNIEGTIPQEVCKLTTDSILQDSTVLQIQADCSVGETSVPFITCDCCTICCDHITHICNNQDGLE